jgi:hypothetical protein
MRRIRCDYATLRIYWGDTSLDVSLRVFTSLYESLRVFTCLYESLRVLFVRLLERVEERMFLNAFLTALDIIIILYYSIYYIKNEW